MNLSHQYWLYAINLRHSGIFLLKQKKTFSCIKYAQTETQTPNLLITKSARYPLHHTIRWKLWCFCPSVSSRCWCRGLRQKASPTSTTNVLMMLILNRQTVFLNYCQCCSRTSQHFDMVWQKAPPTSTFVGLLLYFNRIAILSNYC